MSWTNEDGKVNLIVAQTAGGATGEAVPASVASVPAPVVRVAEKSAKSRAVAAILAFFLGQLGVHRFYAGKVETGVVMAALTLVGYASYFLFVVGFLFIATVVIWNVYDLVTILAGKFRDSERRVLSVWNA